MSPFYTQSGDDGFTSLLGEGRVLKSHPQTEALGTLDETSAALGVARALCSDPQVCSLIVSIQRDLYRMMAEVASTPENSSRFHSIETNRITWLEEQIEILSHQVDLPQEFIIPGDSLPSALLSLARTMVRRSERRITDLMQLGLLENRQILRYLNRLSSLCFVMELVEIKKSGTEKPTIAKEAPKP